MHQPVTSWGNACSACIHKPVRCMHQPVMLQADACTYCMGSVVSISSRIYFHLQLLWVTRKCCKNISRNYFFPTTTQKLMESYRCIYTSDLRVRLSGHLVSISPTFYEQLLHQNPFAKKLQTKFCAHKSCAKSIGMTVNFTNILRAAFSYQSSLRCLYVLTIWVSNFLAKGFWRKSCS
jgi:hypothetical protein